MAKSRCEQIVEQWRAFHERHPEVWVAFVRKTLELIKEGRDRASAKLVIEHCRWNTRVGDDGNRYFKINNTFAPYYARSFMSAYPKHDGFFRIRELTSKEAPAINLPPLGPEDYPYE